jgi:hypothetical protein
LIISTINSLFLKVGNILATYFGENGSIANLTPRNST